jgi:CO dehydrogenase maturation factor
MEHISRLTTNNIDLLVVVSDASRRGIQAAARIVELTQQLPLNIKQKAFLINQSKEGQEKDIEKSIREFGLELSGVIPEDPLVREFDLSGKPTTQLTMKSKAVEAAFSIFQRILP